MSEYLLSLISISTIWSLPWLIKAPAFAFAGYFGIRSLYSAFAFKPLTTVSSLVWIVCLAIFLTHFGHRLASIIL